MKLKITLFQGILLGVFVLGAMIGLFVFATHRGGGGGAHSVGTVEVWGTLPKTQLGGFFSSLSQSQHDFSGVKYTQKDPASLPSDLATAIATGNAPDLVLASQEQLLSLRKFITPIPLSTLSSRTYASTFIGEASLFTAPSGYYGMPFLVDPMVLFSNSAILSSDGIAQAPKDWESLTGLVPNVAILSPTRQVTRALIALGTYGNVHDARGILSTLFLQTDVPVTTVANGQVSASLGVGGSSGSQQASPGEAALRFYTQFADPSKVSYTWNQSLPDSQSAFTSGDAALYLGYVSEAKFLEQANPNLNFDVTPIPEPQTAQYKNTYGLLYAFMIPRGAKNPGGGYQVAALLTQPANQKLAASDTGMAPVVRSVLATSPQDPVAAVAYVSALYAKGWLSPPPATTDQIFSAMIDNVISGRMTLSSSLSSAEKSLNAALNQ